MPQVTLKPNQLPSEHPAVTPSGRWTRKAQRLLRSRSVRSRGAKAARRSASYTWVRRENPSIERLVRNTELFYRIADEIETFPEEYNQAAWGRKRDTAPCGTAFCIAGHAAHLTGWQPTSTAWFSVIRPKETRNNAIDISTVGRAELGLSYNESQFLFDQYWRPKRGLTVPQALRRIGDGEKISTVSYKPRGANLVNLNMVLSEERQRKTIRKTGKTPVYA